MTARFIYQAGNEHSPSDPFGQETLTLTDDGRFQYERRKRGQVWKRTGSADAAVLAGLVEAMEAAGFPVVPPHRIPPGGGLVRITVDGDSATMDYFQGRKFPGYNAMIRIGDGWCRWLRRAEGEPPEGMRLEG